MSFAQKIAHSVVDMSINSLIRRCERAIGEVSSPTAQKAVESVLALQAMRSMLPGVNRSLTFVLIRCTLFSGRARAQIPTTTVLGK